MIPVEFSDLGEGMIVDPACVWWPGVTFRSGYRFLTCTHRSVRTYGDGGPPEEIIRFRPATRAEIAAVPSAYWHEHFDVRTPQ